VLPFPDSLSTQISPPIRSITLRHRGNLEAHQAACPLSRDFENQLLGGAGKSRPDGAVAEGGRRRSHVAA